MALHTFARTAAALAAGAAFALAAVPAGAATPSYSKVVAFGDSLTDTGNVLEVTTVLSGIFPGAFTPLPQPADYFNGRFSNGRVAVEVLADGLKGGLNDGQSLFLENYAYGGAQTGVNGNDLPNTGMLSQLSSYQKSLAPGVGADANALYFVWGGGNDLRSAASNPGAAPMIIGDALTNLGNIVGTLYGMGARNFLLPNLPDLGITPEGLGAGAIGSFLATSASEAFNNGMAAMLVPQLSMLPGIHLMTVDTMGTQRTITANPAAYGLDNVTDGCFTGYVGISGTHCASPGTSLYWDRVHPTTRGHEILGQAMLAAAVPEPGTMLMMGAGVLAMLSLGRRRRG